MAKRSRLGWVSPFLALEACLFPVGLSSKAAKSLYPLGHSAVEEIDPDELGRLSSHAADAHYTSIVEFYAPWCPHCQHFAPKYEAVAEHFVGQASVRVAAVDCVAHQRTCSDQKVTGYPTLKVYHALGEPSSLEEGGHVLKGGLLKGSASLIEWVEKHLLAPPDPGGRHQGSPLPDAAELEAARLAEEAVAAEEASLSFSAVSTGRIHHSHATGLGVEAPEVARDPRAESAHAPMRPSVMLEHSGERWDARFTGPPDWGGRARLGDACASLLFALHYGVFVEGHSLSEGQAEALRGFLDLLARAFPGPHANREALASLRDRVTAGGREAQAFGEGLGEGGAKHSAKQARKRAAKAAEGKPLRTDREWLAYLDENFFLMGKVSTADQIEWGPVCDVAKRAATSLSTKKDGDGGERGQGRHITVGYTCGLWTLFHMLSVAAPRAGLTAGATLAGIRSFVEHFFGCAHCRDHFLTMFDACELGRCDLELDAPPPPTPGDAAQASGRSGRSGKGEGGELERAYWSAHRASALWLWKAHNVVNVRVANDALQDEYAKAEALRQAARHRSGSSSSAEASGDHGGGFESSMKVLDLDPSWALWPPPRTCPECFLSTARGTARSTARGTPLKIRPQLGSDSRGGRGFEAPEFDEDAVYRFLVESYDVGLWQPSPIAALSLARRWTDKLSHKHGNLPRLVKVLAALSPVLLILVATWLKKRSKVKSGAHKKLEDGGFDKKI